VRSDEETRALLIEAADRAFGAQGYAAACIADVARDAGVSTKTLYRLVPTKAALFESVVADRIDRVVLELDLDRADDAAAAIEELAFAYGRFALNPGVAGVNRLILAEGAQFPEIRDYFYEKAVLRVRDAMVRPLARLAERGLIALDDPQEAAEMLRGMMAMDAQRALMLGRLDAPAEAEIRARARRCARLFLFGCAPRG
jgi:AcrR family transcriptional regulator